MDEDTLVSLIKEVLAAIEWNNEWVEWCSLDEAELCKEEAQNNINNLTLLIEGNLPVTVNGITYDD